MADVWTHGRWTVHPGREDEFVRLWSSLRDIGLSLGGAAPVLLRDRDDPAVFVSFGAWPDLETIAAFRSSPEFGATVAKLQDVLSGFEPHTLDEVVGP